MTYFQNNGTSSLSNKRGTYESDMAGYSGSWRTDKETLLNLYLFSTCACFNVVKDTIPLWHFLVQSSFFLKYNLSQTVLNSLSVFHGKHAYIYMVSIVYWSKPNGETLVSETYICYGFICFWSACKHFSQDTKVTEAGFFCEFLWVCLTLIGYWHSSFNFPSIIRSNCINPRLKLTEVTDYCLQLRP